MILTLAGSIVVLVWIYLLLFRGAFWLFREDALVATAPQSAPRIAVVIPARNEAVVVARAISSLAVQRYAGEFHIVLVDDDSSDGTADAARSAAPPGLLTIVRAAPLPNGWTGKLWAVSEGICYAERFHPDYLLLTDADIVHPPTNLALLTRRAEGGGYDLVSFMATLQCHTLAERTLIPAFVFFFFMLYPPAWIRDPRRTTAGAAGGCILIRRGALERIGGIAAIRSQLIDDCALARAVKSKGGRVWLGLSTQMRSIRESTSFAEIWRMISRTAFTQLNHSALLLVGTVLGLGLAYALPPALAIMAGPPASMLGGAAWFLMAVVYFPACRFYRRSPLWAPLLPLIATFYAAATIASAASYWRGTGGLWKGRVQDLPRNQE